MTEREENDIDKMIAAHEKAAAALTAILDRARAEIEALHLPFGSPYRGYDLEDLILPAGDLILYSSAYILAVATQTVLALPKTKGRSDDR